MQREQCVELHDGEVVSEKNESRNVDDVLWTIPQMWKQLCCTRCHKPHYVTYYHIPIKRVRCAVECYMWMDLPPGQMVATIFNRYRTFVNDVRYQTWPQEQCEWVV